MVEDKVQAEKQPDTWRKIKRYTVAQRLETRLLQIATTAQEISSMEQDTYQATLAMLANKVAVDQTSKEALLSLRQIIDDLFRDIEDIDNEGTMRED